MAQWKEKLTPRLIVVGVLVLGLLTAGSAALLKGSPGEDGTGGVEIVAQNESAPGEIAEAPADSGSKDMPKILPMPPREGDRGEEAELVVERGVSRERLFTLLSEVFDGEVDMPAGDGPVTRAEVARAIVAALGLEEVAEAHKPSELIYRDVPEDHDGFAAVAMMERLGLYPFHIGTMFAPDERVQWAEVRFTVDVAKALEEVAGPVIHVNGPARTVSVEWTPRHATAYVVNEGTLVVRNGEIVSLERLRPGDDVHGFADDEGQLFVAIAAGPVGSAGVSDEVMALVRELATPEQLAAIIRRDWDRAAVELKGSVYNQLLERGATAEEAEALLDRDWAIVEERGKVRLTELISDTTDVNDELVRAVLDGDWDTALGFIEVEVLEYVLNHLVV